MSRIGNGLALPRAVSSLAGSLVHRLTHTAAWVLSQFRELNHQHLTPDECEKRGLPEGSTEPHIYCWPLANGRWWRFDAWSDGDCLHIDALGWTGEVHYIPKARKEAATV